MALILNSSLSDNHNPCPSGKSRLEWLDAMRGFTMILVVANHIAGVGFDLAPRRSSSLELLVLFRMPLFFFVSGFLAYKAKAVWTGKTLSRSLLKKLRVQLLPTAVFLLAFIMYRYRDVWPNLLDALANSRKGGYWFTWVLLQMFVVYYLFAFLEQRLLDMRRWRMPRWLPIAALWLLAAFIYESAYLPKVFTYPKQPWVQALSLNCFAMYFLYFVTGNIARRYWQRMERLFDSRWFFPLVCAVAFLCCTEIFKWHLLKYAWRNLPLTVAVFALLALVVMIFRGNERTFSKETRTGRAMQYIGVRTLDIYLLHFFFLPHLPMVGEFLGKNRPNIVLEQALTVGLALLVIAFCCLVSSALRTSPMLKKYLFGR